MLNVTLERLLEGLPPNIPPPPWSPCGPPGPRPNVPPRAPPPPADSFFSPKPKVLLNRMFNVNRAGPVPSLIGMPICPGRIWSFRQPYGVVITPEAPHVPSVGRALNVLIPYTS